MRPLWPGRGRAGPLHVGRGAPSPTRHSGLDGARGESCVGPRDRAARHHVRRHVDAAVRAAADRLHGAAARLARRVRPISPHISPHLPTSPHISPLLDSLGACARRLCPRGGGAGLISLLPPPPRRGQASTSAGRTRPALRRGGRLGAAHVLHLLGRRLLAAGAASYRASLACV